MKNIVLLIASAFVSCSYGMYSQVQTGNVANMMSPVFGTGVSSITDSGIGKLLVDVATAQMGAHRSPIGMQNALVKINVRAENIPSFDCVRVGRIKCKVSNSDPFYQVHALTPNGAVFLYQSETHQNNPNPQFQPSQPLNSAFFLNPNNRIIIQFYDNDKYTIEPIGQVRVSVNDLVQQRDGTYNSHQIVCAEGTHEANRGKHCGIAFITATNLPSPSPSGAPYGYPGGGYQQALPGQYGQQGISQPALAAPQTYNALPAPHAPYGPAVAASHNYNTPYGNQQPQQIAGMGGYQSVYPNQQTGLSVQPVGIPGIGGFSNQQNYGANGAYPSLNGGAAGMNQQSYQPVPGMGGYPQGSGMGGQPGW